jgi:hypothetical protein
MKIPCPTAALLLATLLLPTAPRPARAADRPSDAPASSRTEASLEGKWTGTMTVPQGTGTVELTFRREGQAWTAAGKVKLDPSAPAPVQVAARELQVKEKSVMFNLTLEGADVKFTGTLAPGGLGGTLVATESGREVGRGTWKLTRATR